MRLSTTIVVPCYNEANRLDPDAFERFVRRNRSTSFLFVNDGSSDGTADLLETLRFMSPDRFAVIDLAKNGGKGEAVRRGVLHVLRSDQAQFVGYWDADLSTPLNAISRFQRILAARPSIDIVLGARVRLLGRHIERRLVRHLLGRAFATASSLLLDLPVYDTQCGAKMFRVSPTLGSIFGQPFVTRWLFDVEILMRYTRFATGSSAGATLYELPLTRWTDIAGSKLGARAMLGTPVDLARIWWANRPSAMQRPIQLGPQAERPGTESGDASVNQRLRGP